MESLIKTILLVSFLRHFASSTSNLTQLCCPMERDKELETPLNKILFNGQLVNPLHKQKICKDTKDLCLKLGEARVKRNSNNIDNKRPTWLNFVYDFIEFHHLKSVVILETEEDINEHLRIERILSKELHKSYVTTGLLYLGKNASNHRLLKTKTSDYLTGFFTLSESSDLIKAVVKMQNADGISDKNVWLLRSSDPKSSLPDSLRLSINSHYFTYDILSNKSAISIKEAYRVADGWPLKVNTVGMWSDSKGLTWTTEEFWFRRKDLGGMTFNCATEHDPPYIYMDFIAEDSQQFELSGYNYDVWKSFEEKSNFTSTFVRSIDGGWGSLTSNGSFNGMVGMIQRGEVDCAVSGFGLFKGRAKVNDYHSPIGQIRSYVFVISSKESSQDGSMTYISPFTYPMWALVFVTFTVFSCGYFAMAHFGKAVKENYVYDLGLSTLIIAHGMLLQSTPEEPLKLSLRIAMLTIFLAGLIILTSYSACLTSFLAVQVQTFPFVDDETLYHDSTYDILTLDGSGNVDHYKFGNDIQRKIFKERFQLSNSVTDAVKRFQSNPQLALYWLEQSVYDLVDDPCSLQAISQLSLAKPLTNYLAKNWPYTPLFNYHVSKMHQNGELVKLGKKWFTSAGKGCGSQMSSTRPLGINRLYTLFVMVAIAISAGILLLFLERMTYRKPDGTKVLAEDSDTATIEQKQQ